MRPDRLISEDSMKEYIGLLVLVRAAALTVESCIINLNATLHHEHIIKITLPTNLPQLTAQLTARRIPPNYPWLSHWAIVPLPWDDLG